MPEFCTDLIGSTGKVAALGVVMMPVNFKVGLLVAAAAGAVMGLAAAVRRLVWENRVRQVFPR